jgi:3-oxoacyl-[acyl-carrier-protein] synthase-3
MAIVKLTNSKIAGITCTLPRQVITTAEVAAALGADAKKIKAMTGIAERRIAPPEICASDLCADAASRLLDDLEWDRATIDALVLVTQTPDYILPATACILQQRLGLPTTCACFDVNMGCSGYVYGLWIASSLVESGLNRVLLLVGDTSTRCVSEQDRSVAFLFGDSGSATALERGNAKTTFVLGTDGGGAENLIIRAGQARQRMTPELCERVEMEGGNIRSPQELYMNGSEVMAFTLREVPPLFEQLLEHSGTQREQIDAVVMHQANQFLIDNLARKIGIESSRVPSTVEHYGNTSCTSVAVTISSLLQEQISQKSLKLAMMGFGVGWSWAGCIGDFGPIITPPSTYID